MHVTLGSYKKIKRPILVNFVIVSKCFLMMKLHYMYLESSAALSVVLCSGLLIFSRN
jgi:hypothetical protein